MGCTVAKRLLADRFKPNSQSVHRSISLNPSELLGLLELVQISGLKMNLSSPAIQRLGYPKTSVD